MNGTDIERLLALIESSDALNREEIIRYVKEHKAEILAQLHEHGVSEIPVPSGEKLVLRLAVAAA